MQAICILSIGNMRTRCNYDNHRNGYSKKTVVGEDGATEIKVPRDRSGRFEPLLIAKAQKRRAIPPRLQSGNPISSTLSEFHFGEDSADRAERHA